MMLDKETQIKHLKEQVKGYKLLTDVNKENVEALEGKIKFLQDTCRRAGAQIKKLEAELKEANQWKQDEVEKFKARLRDGPAYEKRASDYTEQ